MEGVDFLFNCLADVLFSSAKTTFGTFLPRNQTSVRINKTKHESALILSFTCILHTFAAERQKKLHENFRLVQNSTSPVFIHLLVNKITQLAVACE